MVENNNKLTNEQENYFKNSGVRDKNGNLSVCYQGTSTPCFKEFNPKDSKSRFGNYIFKDSNRIDEDEQDVKELDSVGNILTNEQIEFFKNSIVRDESGKLLVCLHGTSVNFNEFKCPINWFTVDERYSSQFANMGFNKGEKKTYLVYLNCKNIFDCGSTNSYVFKGNTPSERAESYVYSDFTDEFLDITSRLDLDGDELEDFMFDFYDEVLASYDEGGEEGYARKLKIHYITRTATFKNLVKSRGYDSISTIEDGSLCFGVFNANDIKDIKNTKPTQSKNIYEKVSKSGYEPTKKGIAYKVFKIKNGKLYPPMVSNPGGQDTPVGVWLDAEEGEFAGLSKTGRPQVKSIGSGTLSYRPGWHLGDVPRAPQFDRLNKTTGESEFPKDFVWAECEYAMDVDYQPESDARGYERTKIGDDGRVTITKSNKYQHSLAGVPHLPVNGYYKYRTNPNPNNVPWIITGQMKVKRLLSDKEVNEILQSKGIKPIHRQGGDKSLIELGVNEELNLYNSKLRSKKPHGKVMSVSKNNAKLSDIKMSVRDAFYKLNKH